MRLFETAKTPVYCEGIAHRIERRKSGDVKVVDLTLKLDPFTAQLASALDQAEYGFVKRLLFKLTDGSPVRDLRSVDFRPPHDRQQLHCFASPDTKKASICLDQVKVTKLRARSQKDGDGWVLYLYVSFGPLGKTELEYVNAFYTEQRFVTFEPAEPSLDFEDPGDDDDEDEDREARTERPAPMFDSEPDGEPIAAAADPEPARQLPPRHAGGRKPH